LGGGEFVTADEYEDDELEVRGASEGEMGYTSEEERWGISVNSVCGELMDSKDERGVVFGDGKFGDDTLVEGTD
jgi:hypothetical protein